MNYTLYKKFDNGTSANKTVSSTKVNKSTGNLLISDLLNNGWLYNPNVHPDLARQQKSGDAAVIVDERTPEAEKKNLKSSQKKADAVVESSVILDTAQLKAKEAIDYIASLTDSEVIRVSIENETQKTVLAQAEKMIG